MLVRNDQGGIQHIERLPSVFAEGGTTHQFEIVNLHDYACTTMPLQNS